MRHNLLTILFIRTLKLPPNSIEYKYVTIMVIEVPVFYYLYVKICFQYETTIVLTSPQ